MKKVLIIGNDLHFIRYIESLLFVENLDLFIMLDCNKTNKIINKYNIKELNKNDFDDKISNFDYIIYTTPNGFNDKVFNTIKKYKGNLFLEKPQFNISLIKKLKCNIYFIHLRKFDDVIYYKLKKINYIEWPNLSNKGMDAFVNTLPNIIDFISCLYKNIIIDNICVDRIKKSTNIVKFRVSVATDIFIVKIYDTNKTDLCPSMNGMILSWPNFFTCINNFAKNMLQNNISYSDSIKEEEKYINIIEKIRGDF